MNDLPMNEFFVKRPEIEDNFDRFIKLRNQKLLFITGSPGSGKTTMLRYFIDKYSKEKHFDQIVYISGINISSISDFESMVFKEIDPDKWSIAITRSEEYFRNEFIEVLKSQKLLIIIDGLDEGLNQKKQQLFLENLIQYSNYMREDSKIVIASRDVNFSRIPTHLSARPFTQLELGQPSHQNVRDIIEKRLKYLKSTIDISNVEYKKITSLNLEDFSPQVIEMLMHLLDYDHRKIMNLIAKKDFKLEAIMQEFISNIWSTMSEPSKHFIRTLLLFNNTVTVEKLSLLVDINEEEFLDSINELKKNSLIIITGKIISFSHVSIKEAFINFLEQRKGISNNTLDIYIDLNYVDKDQVVELLALLDETYKTIGGDELIIRENEIGQFSCQPEYVKV